MSEENKITAAQYELILKRLDTMQGTMDRRFQEWSEDRQSINDLQSRLKTLEAKLDGARDEISGLKTKLINRMDEHLEPVPEMITTQVKKEINSKSVIEKIKEKIHG